MGIKDKGVRVKGKGEGSERKEGWGREREKGAKEVKEAEKEEE